MSKVTLITVVVFISLTIILSAFSLKVFSPKLSNLKIDKVSYREGNNISPPIAQNKQYIRDMSIVYIIDGKIKKLNSVSNGIEISLDVKGDSLPNFVAKKDTKIFFNDQAKISTGSLKDLSQDQIIALTASYNLKTQAWTTTKIIVFSQVTPNQSTPSAK